MDQGHGAIPSLVRMGLLLAMAAAIFLTGMAIFQDRLLYFPEPASVAESLAATRLPGAKVWPAGEDYRGLQIEPPAGRTPRGTVIVFHGNAGHAGHRGEYAERLGAQGWRVILAEYPGYGPRPGSLGEDSLVADAAASITRARQDFGGPLIVLGESLGAGVAAGAVGTLQRQGAAIDGLGLVTPWDSLASVASHHYPWLPVRWLLADRYDSASALASYRGPVAVVVAAQDEIVPARFGRVLFDAIGGTKTLLVVDGARHNEWMDRVDDAWWGRLMRAAGAND